MVDDPDRAARADAEPAVTGGASGGEDTDGGGGTDVDDTDDAVGNDGGAGSTGPPAAETGVRRGAGGREVVVPMRLYKTVVVFSTLIAIVSFVVGFLLIDAATLQVSLFRTLVVGALAAVGLRPSDGLVTGAFAVAGLSLIAFGAAVYVLGTRFRFREMGKPQEDSGEDSGNG